MQLEFLKLVSHIILPGNFVRLPTGAACYDERSVLCELSLSDIDARFMEAHQTAL